MRDILLLDTSDEHLVSRIAKAKVENMTQSFSRAFNRQVRYRSGVRSSIVIDIDKTGTPHVGLRLTPLPALIDWSLIGSRHKLELMVSSAIT